MIQPSTHPQFDLNPPQDSRFGASLALAVLAHLLLLSALTWGISWHQEAVLESSTAELWSSNPNLTPQVADVVETQEPQEVPAPAPTPAKVSPPTPSKANSEALKDAQLAVEKLKKKEEEKKEKERLAKLELEKQRLKELEKKKQKELELEKAKKLEEEKLKKAKEIEKAKKDAPKPDPKELAKQQAKEAKEMERRRMEDLSRVQKSLSNTSMASASGSGIGPSSASNMSAGSGTGNAMSANYAGKVIDHIKRNMGVHKEFSGNPSTEIKINCAPDGSITLSQMTKKSGDPEWDEVVNKAIEKIRATSKMPRDIDGRVPPTMIISVKPYEGNP